ncbi:Signal transduction histidine kinase [Actinacidiphila rubida]|uniref:histidine kinase n=1 Tax=Actinacidiphila rubida TaxID=310780 RepID=A0A1H8IQK5_9ACTN|nr:histidine kinase [Actinacidiphila rubida]SEN70933.1 Signal transduction histidine kinase [Actinacidiphila rubida]
MQYPARKALCGPYLWLRAHQNAADAGLAAAAFAVMLLGTLVGGVGTYRLGPLESALAALACASLIVRRRWPWAVLIVTCGLSGLFVVVSPIDGRVPVVLAVAVALCTVAARTDRATTWTTGLVAGTGLTALAMAFGPGPWYCQANFALFAWTGMATAAGDAARSRRAYVAAIEERAERAERSREEEARRRVAEERMRIARELHDVVAHHIALVNVQAGVAAHVMDNRPDQAKQALAHVREASRSALDELRATVGLLRQSGEPEAPMEPAPGLAVLDQLLDGFRRAGLRVEIHVESDEASGGCGEHGGRARGAADRGGTLPAGPGPGRERAAAGLPASVDLTAYRIIQESLTNVQKHAGPDAGAVVRISRERDTLEVVVDDDGAPGTASSLLPPPALPRPRPAPESGGESVVPEGVPCPVEGGDPALSGGHGLLGMHERASALGGVCRTGARPGGGFRVWVRLPLSAPPRSRAAHPPAAEGGAA